MVLVEAGLMGRAVIGSDLGGIRDIIRHGYNGLLVPPGDPEALAESVGAVLQERDVATRMGLANREIALDYLSGREQAVKQVRQAICALIEQGRG